MLRIVFAAAVVGASLFVSGQAEAARREVVVSSRPAGGGFFSRLMELERRKNERIREWFRGNR